MTLEDLTEWEASNLLVNIEMPNGIRILNARVHYIIKAGDFLTDKQLDEFYGTYEEIYEKQFKTQSQLHGKNFAKAKAENHTKAILKGARKNRSNRVVFKKENGYFLICPVLHNKPMQIELVKTRP